MSSIRTASPSPSIALVFACYIALVVAGDAEAGELHVKLANDPVAGNSRPDDLYTSDLEIRFRDERVGLAFGERMFTDRSRGLRFDESHVSIEKPLPRIAGWDVSGSVGLLHAGRGLLGESAQNEVHRITRSEKVELPYVTGSETFPTAGLALQRPLGAIAGANVCADLEGYTAPGFRSWLRAGATIDRNIGRSIGVRVAAGARADQVDTPWISRETIHGISPTAHVALAWRSVELRYSWNDYGTRTPHISLGIRAPLALTKLAD